MIVKTQTYICHGWCTYTQLNSYFSVYIYICWLCIEPQVRPRKKKKKQKTEVEKSLFSKIYADWRFWMRNTLILFVLCEQSYLILHSSLSACKLSSRTRVWLSSGQYLFFGIHKPRFFACSKPFTAVIQVLLCIMCFGVKPGIRLHNTNQVPAKLQLICRIIQWPGTISYTGLTIVSLIAVYVLTTKASTFLIFCLVGTSLFTFEVFAEL